MNPFPSKLLLFGEYSVLLGSPALGWPFHRFCGSLRMPGESAQESEPVMEESNRKLVVLSDYLLAGREYFGEWLDLARLSADVARGLFFLSNIPQHYGLGSSGALCAALYHRYRIEEAADDPVTLKARFARMESFFHGTSSGFDPLVSFLGEPVLLRNRKISICGNSPHLQAGRLGATLFLVDSGEPCPTGSLVTSFLGEYAPGGKVSEKGLAFVTLVENTIGRFLSGDGETLMTEVVKISRFQLDMLPNLIPGPLRAGWNDGLSSGIFALKLCGSGGGGYAFCFTRSPEETREYFLDQGIALIRVADP